MGIDIISNVSFLTQYYVVFRAKYRKRNAALLIYTEVGEMAGEPMC